MEYFKLARIKFEELSTEVTDFVKSVYKTSANMFTPASPWGQIMLTLINISQKIFYYIEDSITEMFMNTASRPNSIRGIARLTGHNPTRAVAASGTLMINHNGVIPQMTGNIVTIPNLSKIKNNDNGLTYLAVFPQESIKVNLYGEKSGIMFKIYQGTAEEQTFTSNGNKYQSFNVPTKYGSYIDQFMISIYVNEVKWKIKDSFQDMLLEEQSCIIKTGIAGGIDIYFGNGSFGAVPESGAIIKVQYLLSNGVDGNIVEEESVDFEFVDTGEDSEGNSINLNEIFNIRLASSVGFASNPEPLFLTKLIAPNMSRSFVLANTSHYTTFFERFQLFSYIDIFTEFDKNRPWKDNIVYGLLIPDINKRYRKGENYFTLPIDYFKLTDVEKLKVLDLIENSGQKIINSVFKFVDPVFKKYVVFLYIKAWEGYNKDTIFENVITNLSNYFSNFTRKDLLPKSDLIAALETIDGLDSVSMFFVSEDIELFLRSIFTLLDNGDAITTVTQDTYTEIPSQFWNGDNSIMKQIKMEHDNYKTYKNITKLSKEEKLHIIFSHLEIREYLDNFIDINGDIVIKKGTIPMIRGGWLDRDGNEFLNSVNKNMLSSVNVIFTTDSQRVNANTLTRNSYNKMVTSI